MNSRPRRACREFVLEEKDSVEDERGILSGMRGTDCSAKADG
jgi:hypothetical protein